VYGQAPYNLSCAHIVPLLGYSANRGVQDLPTNFGVPTTRPFVGPTGTPIADDWSALINMAAGVGDTLLAANVLFYTPGEVNTEFAWTGFTVGGAASANNCGDWQVASKGNCVSSPTYFRNATWAPWPEDCTTNMMEVMCLCWNP
jgi:hypothetical protein